MLEPASTYYLLPFIRPERHPANTAWAAAHNGMQWLLDMNWAEFDANMTGTISNQAAPM
ncbi:MAG: hypothetical protein ACOC7X_13030 [Spirochaetota bacterium]